MIRVQIKLQGWEELRKTFLALRKGVRNRVSKLALQAGARPIAKAMKRNAPIAKPDQTTRGIPVGVGRGLYRKSIGMRGKISRRTGIAFVVVGPRRKKFKTLIGHSPKYGAVYMNPTNYAHLRETGHQIKMSGGRTVNSPGTHPMERAFEQSVSQAQAAIEAKFREGVEREARKAAIVK